MALNTDLFKKRLARLRILQTLIALALAGWLVIVGFQLVNQTLKYLHANQQILARILSSRLALEVEPLLKTKQPSEQALQEVLESYASDPVIHDAVIYTMEGETLAQSSQAVPVSILLELGGETPEGEETPLIEDAEKETADGDTPPAIESDPEQPAKDPGREDGEPTRMVGELTPYIATIGEIEAPLGYVRMTVNSSRLWEKSQEYLDFGYYALLKLGLGMLAISFLLTRALSGKRYRWMAYARHPMWLAHHAPWKLGRRNAAPEPARTTPEQPLPGTSPDHASPATAASAAVPKESDQEAPPSSAADKPANDTSAK